MPIPKSYPADLDRALPRQCVLMSQGEVRPGMVQGQHWSESRIDMSPLADAVSVAPTGSVGIVRVDPYAARPEWIDTHHQFRRMAPSFRQNLALSNPGLR